MKDIGKFKRKYKQQVHELQQAKASRESIEAEIRAEYEEKLDAERQATRDAIATLRREAADQTLRATNLRTETGEIAMMLHEARDAIARQREENNALIAKVAELQLSLAAVEPRILAADARTAEATRACNDLADILRNHESRLRKKDEAKVDAVLNRAALRGVLPTRNVRT